MARLSDVQAKVRKDSKWRFLAEMLEETDGPTALAGVTYKGVLLVNPDLAVELPTARLIEGVRNEFKVAAELRKGVRGFV